MKKDLDGSEKENLDLPEAGSERAQPPESSSLPTTTAQPITINQLNEAASTLMIESIPCLSSSLRWKNNVADPGTRRQSDGTLTPYLRKCLTSKNSRGNVSRESGKASDLCFSGFLKMTDSMPPLRITFFFPSVTSIGSVRNAFSGNDFDTISLLEEHRRRSSLLSVCDVLSEPDEAVLRGLLRQWSEQHNRLELKNYLTDMKVDKTFITLNRNCPSSDDEGIRYCSTSPGQIEKLGALGRRTSTMVHEEKSGGTFVKLKPLTEEELKLVPLDDEGNLTSIGSIAHNAGEGVKYICMPRFPMLIMLSVHRPLPAMRLLQESKKTSRLCQ